MGGRRLGSGGFGPEGAKQCPSCDETVAPHAVACRHCGVSLILAPRDVDDGAGGAPPREPDDDATMRRERSTVQRFAAVERQSGDRRQERSPGGRSPAAARRGANDEPEWNVPDDRPPVEAPREAQWNESDFERISQTAGLPREDPRTREPRRKRGGFAPWRRQAGRAALGGAAATGRALKRDTRVVWIGGAVALAVVGATAGWATGRWDDGSWIGRQYQAAADLMRSVTMLPEALEGEPRVVLPSTAPAASGAGEAAAPVASTPAAPPPSSIAAAPPTVVDPRPAAAPPGGGLRAASPARPTTSLVPIKPTATTAALVEAAPPTLASEAWSVRDVQRELARLGYYQGGVDGEVGPMTRSAVRAFQQDAGLQPTGRIEPAVLTALSDRAGTPRSKKPEGSP